MKRYIYSNNTEGKSYNIIWYTQRGDQCGGNVLVPPEYEHDPYSYIERYLSNNYSDEFGGLIDYIESCDSITSSEEIATSEYDEWSPYHNHNYLVSAGPYGDVTMLCDDPKRAITHWFKYQKKYPLDVSISCPTRDLAIKLVEAGKPKLLTELFNRFDCPYKLEYMIDECKKKAADGCKGFYESEYGDQVHPFGVG